MIDEGEGEAAETMEWMRTTSEGAPPELWEVAKSRLEGWFGAHPGVVGILRRVTVVSRIATVVLFILAVLFVPRFWHMVWPALMLVADLAILTVLARTRTVSWGSILRMYTLSIPWAVCIAALTAMAGSLVGLGVHEDGLVVYAAAFFEEPGKLVPLLVLAAVAPGRMRRFSAADWFLLGTASGAGFQAAEDAARRAQGGFAAILRDLLGSGDIEYGLNPWTSGAFTNGDSAMITGHHITTGIVAVAIGLGIQVWRRGTVRGRALGAALPAGAMIFVLAAHSGYNASVSSSWDGAWGESGHSILLRLLWALSLHGHLIVPVSVCLFVTALVADSLRREDAGPAGRILKLPVGAVQSANTETPGHSSPRSRLLVGIRALVTQTAEELYSVLMAFKPVDSDRDAGALRGRIMRARILVVRGQAMTATTAGPEPESRRRFRRFALIVGLSSLALCVAYSLIEANIVARGGLFAAPVSPPEPAYFAAILGALAQWWDGLGLFNQILIAALVMAALTALLGSFGWAMAVGGVIMWVAEHGGGLAALMRDPKGAVKSYFENLTLGSLLLDLFDFGTTFIPSSALGKVFGKALSRILGRGGRITEEVLEAAAKEGADGAALLATRRGTRPGWHTETAQELVNGRHAIQVAKARADRALEDAVADFCRNGRLPAEYNDPSLFYASRLDDTLKTLRADPGVSPRTVAELRKAAQTRIDNYSKLTHQGERIGEVGGEVYLHQNAYDIPEAFRSSANPSPGAYKVDGLAVGPNADEIVIPEYKGMGGRTSRAELLGGGSAMQGTPEYVMDRMLRDGRVIEYFRNAPDVWEKVKSGQTGLRAMILRTEDSGSAVLSSDHLFRVAGANAHPDGANWIQEMQRLIDNV